MTSPTNESLATDYMRDLQVDIECADRDGHPKYADECRAELKSLQEAKSIRITGYGMPSVD